MKAKPKRKSVSVTAKRRANNLKLPKLIDDPILIDEIRESFKRSFFVKGMKYTTSLVFDTEACPEDKNDV